MDKTIGAHSTLRDEQELQEVGVPYRVSRGRREAVVHSTPTLGVPRTLC